MMITWMAYILVIIIIKLKEGRGSKLQKLKKHIKIINFSFPK